MLTRRLALLGALSTLSAPALALPFDDLWRHQTFPRRKGNDFSANGNALAINSDGGVSLFIREVPRENWDARGASWRWRVDQGVPATDLTRKGGEDRNLALYFVFLPQEVAEGLTGASPRRVLTHRAARVLVYVWGGDAPRGRILPNPWAGGQGRLVVLRPAGTGNHAEQVDLRSDFSRAFGADAGALFGLAISADSDDTGARIRARVEGLRLA
jgi:hypothetical protein